ncbi:MAG TPA: 23S rRNA (adenine(2503)-C(2))-methyltransferase RlmN [Phycisphaerae bacterium]|nr:23S rRNA (adenine(2503)-C(2))-methyltransferase RlmN [Phycisphaerae bacterium]
MNASDSHQHVLDLTPDRLAELLTSSGEKPFRARQVLEWVYQHGAVSFDEMTNLSKPLREMLKQRLVVYASEIIRRSVSSDGTVKLLLKWPDGATSECVLIPEEPRRTACISSQVGCPVGCRFCASGMNGLQRNLTAGQIVEQVLRVGAEAAADGGRLSNVVFMGLGEPLANYDAVMSAVRTINASWGPNIGARKITISTVGLPKQIRRLADEGLQLNLALSLHAPTDELREQLIPWARKISIADIIEACRYYFEKTGREITLEYILLHEVNDRRTHAQQLARFAKQLRCNINLIRYNVVEGLPFARPSGEEAHVFQRELREHGVNAHIRTSRGLDIEAACGQLRRREMLEAQAGEGRQPPVRIGIERRE